MKEKSTRELMEEKEEMIKEYDQKIYESSQKSMAISRKGREERLAERQQLEEDGWNSSYISPHQPAIEEAIIIEIVPKVDKKADHMKMEAELAEIERKEKIEHEKALLRAKLEVLEESVEAIKAVDEVLEEEGE